MTKKKWDNASHLRRLSDNGLKRTRLGSINEIGWNISDKEAEWLLLQAAKHNMSVAEWLSGLVSDAYWEENEDGN